MLQNLSVRNFLLIDALDLDFSAKFCVITGETGAGKSIILDAIIFCLGGKIRKDLKYNDNNISVSATFCNVRQEVIKYLEDLNIDLFETITIKRIEGLNKAKRFFINDILVTPKTIEFISPFLLEVHGQNSHISLLSRSVHIDILDEFGGLQKHRSEVEALYSKLQKTRSEIKHLQNDKESIKNEIDYLNFVVEELSKLGVKEGEETTLADLRSEIKTQQKEKDSVTEILYQLEKSAISESIGKILRYIARKDQEDLKWQKITKNFESAYDLIEDSNCILKNYLNSYAADNLEEIEERLFIIKDLARKYKIQSSEIISFLSDSKSKLDELTKKIKDENNLENELNEIELEYKTKANALSHERKIVALKLTELVQQSLVILEMPKAIFNIQINVSISSPKGIDDVSFTASTNPGMPLKTIDKIASGGELARLSLALKTALFDKFQKSLMIFDEIDTGIGGNTASAVGEHLKKLSTSAQVLVITHQAQIASKANVHILVTKLQSIHKTKITVNILNYNQRKQEIARMIAGHNITDATIKTAEELLTFV